MKPAESGTSTQQESSPTVRMTGFCKEFQFLTHIKSCPLVVVNKLDALNDFIMKLLDQSLSPKVALIVELMTSNATEILCQVLP